MVTGASTADLAIILIDARHGMMEQTHRHSFIASLLGIKHLVVCVNKMDLVDFNEDKYQQITAAYRNFASRLDIPDIKFIPISALLGDNVVDASTQMHWYTGTTLLQHLEEVHVGGDRNLQDCRFPIQYVIRPQIDGARDFRGYAGRIASGVFKVGDDIVALPSGMGSKIKEIFVGAQSIEAAFPPQSVTITLETDIDLSRGDMMVRANNQPESLQEIDAQVCWMGDEPLNPGIRYIVRHGTSKIKSMIREVLYKVDINTLHRNEEDKSIGMNDIARIKLRTASPLLVDDYRRNRTTGSFVLIDPNSNLTVAAGFIS
jgi:sulfate adenylyltransferase subunit 1